MSGTRAKRHHFLPRLLLNGFASRTSRGETYTWYFRKGQTPREPNIINVAAARYFHGRGNIEDKLAEEEGAYGGLVRELRQGRIPAGKEPLVAEFVSHLIVRTKHLRDGLESMMTLVTPAFLDAFAAPENQARVRRLMLQQAEPTLRSLPPALRSMVLAEFESFIARLPALIRAERQAKGDPVVSADASQLKALSGPVNAIDRTAFLQELSWGVVATGRGALVLGDIGPVARGGGKPRLESPLKFNAEVPDAVYLPVSAEHLLVGQRVPGPIDDVETVNLAVVELSREFFVARQNTERERRYLLHLGKRTEFLDAAEVSRQAAELFRND